MSSPPSELKPSQFVRAGAGAGKTYSLTHEVLDYAKTFRLKEDRDPKVIVTTFTRKATQELKERLLILALEEYPDLVNFVNSKSKLHVSTIHGVTDLFLKRYGIILGLDPNYKIMGGLESDRFIKSLVSQKYMGRAELQSLLEIYNFSTLIDLFKKSAVYFLEDPSARFCTPEDFEKLLNQDLLQFKTCLLEFSRDVRECSPNEKWIDFVAQLEDSLHLLEKGPKGLQEFLQVFADLKKPRKGKSDSPELQVLSDFFTKDLKAKRVKKLSEPEYTKEFWDFSADVYRDFESLSRDVCQDLLATKLKQGKIDIHDLELLTAKLLNEEPSTGRAFSHEWDYWLVDEFQDTSPFQLKILEQLIGDRPKYMVGDPQQSIYLFRGARSRVFFETQEEVKSQGGSLDFKKLNRRSHPETLHFINDLFTSFGDQFAAMDPHLEGRSVDSTKKVAEIWCINDKDEVDLGIDKEAHSLVYSIEQLLKKEPNIALDRICVLARKNSTLTRIAQVLSEFNYPFHIHSSSAFFERREILDCIALLRFILNPHDNKNFISLCRSPWFRIEDDILATITRDSGFSHWENRIQAEGHPVIKTLENYLKRSRECGIVQCFEEALAESLMLDFHWHRDPSGRVEANIWKFIYLLQLEERKAGFNPFSFIDQLGKEIQIEESDGEGDAVAILEPNRINLMTVHASKGLEFDHIFIPEINKKPRTKTNLDFTYNEDNHLMSFRVPWGDEGANKGNLNEKLWLRHLNEEELLESQRVFYVACSRAVKSIHLFWEKEIEEGSWADQLPFDFLKEGRVQKDHYSYDVFKCHESPQAYSSGDGGFEKRDYFKPESLQEEDQSLSVSELLQSKKYFAKDSVLNWVDRSEKANRGTEIHQYLESLKYLEDSDIKHWPEDVQKAVEFVRNSKEPPLAEIIERGEVEFGFILNLDSSRIEGQIDLWGQLENGDYWLIDYKTGQAKYKSKAFDQMNIYALALRQLQGLKEDHPIHLAAVFPLEEKIFWEEAKTNSEIKVQFISG